MILSSPLPVRRSILPMLLLVFALLAATSSAPGWGPEEVGSRTADESAASADGTSYGMDRAHTSRGLVQPAPVVLMVPHEHVSRRQTHVYTDTPPFTTNRVPSAHTAGRSPAVETVCIDCEGRHRHRWVRTHRC